MAPITGTLEADEVTTIELGPRVYEVTVATDHDDIWFTTDGSDPYEDSPVAHHVLDYARSLTVPVGGGNETKLLKLWSETTPAYTVTLGAPADTSFTALDHAATDHTDIPGAGGDQSGASVALVVVTFGAFIQSPAPFSWQGALVDAGEFPVLIPGPTGIAFPNAGQTPVSFGGALVTLPAGLTDRFFGWEFYVTDLTGANSIAVSNTGNGVLLVEGDNTIAMEANSEAGAPTGTDLSFDAGDVVSVAGGAFLVTSQFAIRGPD